MGMRNDASKAPQGIGGGGVPRQGRNSSGFIPRALSSYLRIVSSGASTVASTVKSAASVASAIVDRDSEAIHDQVSWAGFDRLENEDGITRQVLLLACRYAFQVWDVSETENVHNLVTRHDGPVSFMQILPCPALTRHGHKFTDSHPLLVICADGSFSGGIDGKEGKGPPCNETVQFRDPSNVSLVPTVVWFYSLRSHSYVHLLKFRSVVHLVRCSSRIVAVLQSSQIHCFSSATLEREYTIVTNPVVTGSSGLKGIGFGPLAVGPRWMAYSGSPVVVSNSGRVSPQNLTPASFPSHATNGSLVMHYAKESSSHFAAGIATLGGMGYKKLSRYYSELLPDSKAHSGSSLVKGQGITNSPLPHTDNVGVVIVRDIASKMVVAQFRAHKSPISSLCFDPSGTILVTASIQGHNINVFRIMPRQGGNSVEADCGASYVHLYRLQRGFTNAVIQDICFSSDSHWIMISSSRGTSHIFAISPSGGSVSFESAEAWHGSGDGISGRQTHASLGWVPNSGLQMLNQQSICVSGPPITLSVVGRIRNGNKCWRDTITGAAAAATWKASSLPGSVIASAFQISEGSDLDTRMMKINYSLLVFSPGCIIQYALRLRSKLEYESTMPGTGTNPDCDARLVVEAIQKWNISPKQNSKSREDNIDIYGEIGNTDNSKVFPEQTNNQNGFYSRNRVMTTNRIGTEDRHHVYISQAELHTHRPSIPMWMKHEIFVQSMVTDNTNLDEEGTTGGEIEVERIPTHMAKARSKDLIPVSDHLQTLRSQQVSTFRIPLLDINNTGRLQAQQGSEVLSQNEKFTSRNSSGSLTGSVTSVTEMHSETDETGPGGLNAKGFVNSSGGYPELVNNKESLLEESQYKFVNNGNDRLKMVTEFEDYGGEFD